MRNILTYVCLLALTFVACNKKQDVAIDSEWADANRWYMSDSGAGRVDVLYLVATEVLSATDDQGRELWQSTLSDDDRSAMTAEMEWVQTQMFDSAFFFVSPYYHQFDFASIIQLSPASFDSVYALVAKEVMDAFDYYATVINPDRPFVLAGFSQGAMLTLDLLRHMTEQQYERMVACYCMGYRLTADDLAHPHIRAAFDDKERGVVISFNSVLTREAIWPMVSEGAATCINPVNWKTDSTPAVFSFDGTTNTVSVDQEMHVLLVETDNPDYYRQGMDAMPFFYDAGVSRDNLHHWDLLFYPRAIHENALLRSTSKGFSYVPFHTRVRK